LKKKEFVLFTLNNHYVQTLADYKNIYPKNIYERKN